MILQIYTYFTIAILFAWLKEVIFPFNMKAHTHTYIKVRLYMYVYIMQYIQKMCKRNMH